MKNYLVIGIAVIFLSGATYAEELIQKIDIAIGVEGGNDGYYDDDEDEDNFIWIGPGWYGGYWFGTEGDFDNRHHNQWHGGHGEGGHGHGGGGGDGGGGGGGGHR